MLLSRTAGVDLLAIDAAGLPAGLAATLAALRGRGLEALVRLAVAVVVLSIAVRIQRGVTTLTDN